MARKRDDSRRDRLREHLRGADADLEAQGPGAQATPMPEQPAPRRTAVPFLVALGVFAVVLTVIALLAVVGGDGLSEEQRVGRAAVGQNDALQRDSYTDYRSFTCAALHGDEAAVLDAQRRSREADGARYVDDVTDVRIDGDRATATVRYHFADSADEERSAPLAFVREGGAWTVCAAYPAG